MKSPNNIDKLFADKLSSLESTPSSDAWLALEKGLQQKNKKKPIWLPYSVAAAVLILLLSGILLHNQFNSEFNGQENVAITTPPVKEKIYSQEKQAAPTQPKSETNNQVAQGQPSTPESISKQEKLQVRPDTPATIEFKQNKQRQPNTTFELASTKQPALRQLPDIQEKAALQRSIPMPDITRAMTAMDASTIVVTVRLDEPLSLEESEDADESASPARQGKAARLLDKLRKLKKGEFDELGLNKQNLVAFVKVNSGRSVHPDNSHE